MLMLSRLFRSRIRLIVLTFAAFIAACSSALHAAPPSEAEIHSKLDAIAADYLKRPGAVGISVGVARNGQVIIAKAYGLADVELDVPANKDTMFRIGSITKQFTAAAIMRFVEQGKISLDDDITKYLPEPGFPMQGNTVTVRQLLNHTSGIPSYTDQNDWFKLIPQELTHDEMLALVKDKPFDFKPGQKHKYNNTGYYMLGMIIEKISGRTYAEHMQDEFFKPLGLERTTYGFNIPIIKNRAKGYGATNGTIENAPHLGMSQPFAAGSLLSTGEDLVKWSMALTSGKVVTPESYSLMTTPCILPAAEGQQGENTHYGFGLEIGEWEGRPCIRHGGGIHGFNSSYMYLPGDDVHIAVICNSPTGSSRILNDIAQEVVGIEKVVAKDVPIPAQMMKRITGDYTLMKMDVKIWDEGGKAMVQPQKQDAFQILWQGPDTSGGNEFRASFDHQVKLLFANDAQSFTLFQGGRQIQVTRAKSPE
jgi:D-alanyl-D-alanine carboxypeptidase